MHRLFRIIFIILVSLVAALFAMSACRHSGPDRSILPEDADLREGDILFRRGRGVTSRIVYAADIHGKYSHVGMVVMTDSGLMVAHAVPDEPDFKGDPDRVKLERPEKFYSHFRAECGAIGRVPDSRTASAAAAHALKAAKDRVLFDHDYDDSDPSQLYCCELVINAFKKSGLLLTPPSLHNMYLPGLIDATCNLPSDIYDSPELKVIRIF